MRWDRHPLLSRHNTFTFRFLPGVLVGIAISWWVNDRPRQVHAWPPAAQHSEQAYFVFGSPWFLCKQCTIRSCMRRLSATFTMALLSLRHSVSCQLPLLRNLRRS